MLSTLKAYLSIDGNSQFDLPYKFLYYAWATCGIIPVTIGFEKMSLEDVFI